MDLTGKPVIAITRIQLKRAWFLIPALTKYRRLYREAAGDPGFLRGQICIADWRTAVNVSVWQDELSMLRWSGTSVHIDAVRWTYSVASEVWSAVCRLHYASPSARSWSGLLQLAAASAEVQDGRHRAEGLYGTRVESREQLFS